MKIQNLLILFVLALILLVTFQGIWLYSAYKQKLAQTKDILNTNLSESAQKELDARFLEMEKINKEKKESGKSLPDGTIIATFDFNHDKIEKEGIISGQFSLMQQIMLVYNLSFNLTQLDSIYQSILTKNNLHVNYQLTYRDSTQILETTGNNINSGFLTSKIPIVNSTFVQAEVQITPPVVFRNMFWMLTLSLLIMCILIAFLIYETRYIITQHRLNQLREDFTHALTHDMKTPLGTIFMVNSQIKQGILDKNPEMRDKFCEIANEQVLNLQAIIDRILTIAYAEQNKITLNKQEIDLQTIIYKLTDKFLTKGGKEIEFHNRFDLKNVMVYADPLYLENTISNLIDNAIKYSGKSVRIDIECKADDKMIFIIVKDNGSGISKKNQDVIFDKFERGAAISNRNVSGFGLGLNYVKQIILAHGGTIGLSSMENKGSEFIIAIPIILRSINQNFIN